MTLNSKRIWRIGVFDVSILQQIYSTESVYSSGTQVLEAVEAVARIFHIAVWKAED